MVLASMGCNVRELQLIKQKKLLQQADGVLQEGGMDCNCNNEATGSNGLPRSNGLDTRPQLSVAKSKRLRINVGGEAFVTFKQTLDSIPGTRLANLNPSSDSYDPACDEYFFDRNPLLFTFILEGYRTGRLHFPSNICAPLFKEELDYWGLQESRIANCCWKTYVEYEQDKQAINKLNDAIEAHKRLAKKYEERVIGSCVGNFRFKIWTFLEDPSSSKPALVRLTRFVITSLLLLLKKNELIHYWKVNSKGKALGGHYSNNLEVLYFS